MGGSDITSSPFLINTFPSESQKDSDPSDKARSQTHINRRERKEGETQVFREKGQEITRMLSPPHHHHFRLFLQPPPKAGPCPFRGGSTMQEKERGFWS